MFGIVASALISILVRAFYALQDTRTPLTVGLVAIGVNFILAYIFSFSMSLGVLGLPLAYATSVNVQFVMLAVFIRGRMAT
jgi:putative peptidoglycan lipid II flippase